MKRLINKLIAASALAVPALSFAQQTTPVTRAQVRAELGQIEAAGYTGATGPYYPANLHAAETRVARQTVAVQATPGNYGPSTSGSWQSGQPGVSADAR